MTIEARTGTRTAPTIDGLRCPCCRTETLVEEGWTGETVLCTHCGKNHLFVRWWKGRCTSCGGRVDRHLLGNETGFDGDRLHQKTVTFTEEFTEAVPPVHAGDWFAEVSTDVLTH